MGLAPTIHTQLVSGCVRLQSAHQPPTPLLHVVPLPNLVPRKLWQKQVMWGWWGHHPGASHFSSKLGRTADLPPLEHGWCTLSLLIRGIQGTCGSAQSEPSYYSNLMQLFLIGRMVFHFVFEEFGQAVTLPWLGLSVAVRSRGNPLSSL